MTGPPTRFDIDRVRLRHYRSIGACDVRLGPLTVLVGPNGSGKSNFLDSLRLVSQALGENLDNALRERGGVGEVRRRSTGHPTHFKIELDFSGSGASGSYEFEVAAVRGGEYRVSRETCRVLDDSLVESYYEVRDGKVTDSSEKDLPKVAADRLFLVAASGLPAFREVFDGLTGINVHNLSPESMRELAKPDSGELLRRDGANAASVLERLKRDRPGLKERVEEFLSRIVPGIDSADRIGVGSWESVEFRQAMAGSGKPWTFQASSMSDGTLRALGVLLALFSAGDSGYSPIGIEEPESALHLAAAGLLLDALEAASELRQVIVTSHSPDLLDSPVLTSDNILAVRASNGLTTIGSLDVAGQRALRENLYTAGELLKVDQLQPDIDLVAEGSPLSPAAHVEGLVVG